MAESLREGENRDASKRCISHLRSATSATSEPLDLMPTPSEHHGLTIFEPNSHVALTSRPCRRCLPCRVPHLHPLRPTRRSRACLSSSHYITWNTIPDPYFQCWTPIFTLRICQREDRPCSLLNRTQAVRARDCELGFDFPLRSGLYILSGIK